MSGYMEYVENGVRNMSFITENDIALTKYNETWNKIKKTLIIKFHSIPVYDEKESIKAKGKEFNSVVTTDFSDGIVPKEFMHLTCIACISIDYVTKMEKKNYAQVYLGERKYKVKKKKMTEFIDVELEPYSDSE